MRSIEIAAHRAADGNDLLESYLAEMAETLDTSEAAGRDIVDELRDGLLETIETHLRRGLPQDEAVRAGIHAFGDVPELARAFAPELAAARARRLAVGLLGTHPVLAAVWLVALSASRFFRPMLRGQTAMWIVHPAHPIVVLAVVTTVAAGLLVIAATGWPSRWLPNQSRLAPTVAAIAGMSVVVGDVTMLSLVAMQAPVDPGALAPIPVAIAVIVSLLRIRLIAPATHRCLEARAALA